MAKLSAAKKKWPLSDEVQDSFEKAFPLTEDVEVKRINVNAEKLNEKLSQKSAHRQAKKQTTTKQKKAAKQHQTEKKKRKKSSTAGQKKTSMSGVWW